MKPKAAVLILIAVVTASLFASQSVYAQSGQVLNNVSLSHLDVQLTYPSEVLPGQSVTLNVLAKAKDGFRLTSLLVQVYYADQNSLRQLTSTTVAQNLWMSKGDQINKDVQVAVPLDAPRTSLIALVSESVKVRYYDYSYYYPYWYAYEYDDHSYLFYYAYPTYYYVTFSDDAIAPLAYIRATTPEYVTLQSQYQQLQQTLNETQAQNQKLQQDLQTAQNLIAQKDSTITDLNKQLASTQSMLTFVEVVAVALGVAIIATVGLYFQRGKTSAPKDTEQQEKVDSS
jgi:hypothetical protein